MNLNHGLVTPGKEESTCSKRVLSIKVLVPSERPKIADTLIAHGAIEEPHIQTFAVALNREMIFLVIGTGPQARSAGRPARMMKEAATPHRVRHQRRL